MVLGIFPLGPGYGVGLVRSSYRCPPGTVTGLRESPVVAGRG